MSEQRYYWLKLKRDFFKRHDIRIIEAMPNGKDYILFYLKLLCESLDHDGKLRFSDQVPYNEEMLSVITGTNVDVVRTAIQAFSQLGMMDILDDGTIYMTECEKMIGSESEWAEKKRLYRAQQRTMIGQSEDNVQTKKDVVRQEKEKDIEREKEVKKRDSKESRKETSELDKALDAFSQMRRAIRAPMTERAKELIIAKLEKLAPTEAEKIAILNQSIENGWKGVYPLKDDTQTGGRYMTKGEQARKDLQDGYRMIAEWAERKEQEENDEQGIWGVS